MSAEFDRKVACVATAAEVFENDPGFNNVVAAYNLGFAFAWLLYAKMGTLKKEHQWMIAETYEFLLKSMNIPDKKYEHYYDMLNEQEAIAARKVI